MADFTNNMWAGLDPARREAFARAVTSGNSGSKLVQNLTNRIVQQLSLRSYGILGIMDVRAGQGQQAVINRRTAGTAAAWVADTASISEAAGTYAQSTFTYQTLIGEARVTRKIRATGRSYIDILAEEMTKKLEDFNDNLDNGLGWGDPNNEMGLGANTYSVEGFFTAMNTYSSGSQIVNNSSAIASGSTGQSLTLKNLDKAIDLVKGSANRNDLVIVGSYGGLRTLNAALASRQRFNDTVEVAAGYRVRTYDGIPCIPDTNMPDIMTYNTSGSDGNEVVTAYTGGTSTALMVVNKRLNWIEELTPTTVMPLARDTSQYEQFDIFWDGAAVIANPLGSSAVIGISV